MLGLLHGPKWLVATALAAVLATGAVAGEASARPLTTGFYDPVLFEPALAAKRAVNLQRARASGSAIVRIQVIWKGVAESRPIAPRNPADPAYQWGGTDNAVEAAVFNDQSVVLEFQNAPAWAEGADRPGGPTRNGVWKPRPADVADFATALARRYSGRFVDPVHGLLPRVRFYEIWNEPNIDRHLQPQWVRSGGQLRPASPDHYRKMLNAAYTAVKGVNPNNVVISAGTAPYGDPPGGPRMAPALFVRELLCLNRSLQPTSCPDPAHFNALAHHPYNNSNPPSYRAVNRDDVAVADVREKIREPLKAAQRTGRALPAGNKPLWATEFGWESRSLSEATQARWLQEGFYRLWQQGVSTVTWFRVIDVPDSNATGFERMGIYRAGGRKKPAQRAYRFMFVGDRTGGRKVRYWGRAPASGVVAIQRRSGGRW
ncbi:MAG TPA: cellulase family glycosylhydrolase, partial [Gemmatimonadales bacterium]|nr:cellulase family glycosylhydrolase [Gemmatimonadales bacterium]